VRGQTPDLRLIFTDSDCLLHPTADAPEPRAEATSVAELDRATHVVSSHLQRFGQRQGLQLRRQRPCSERDPCVGTRAVRDNSVRRRMVLARDVRDSRFRKAPTICRTRCLKQVLADTGRPSVDVGPVAEVAEVTAHQPEDRSADRWELLLAHHA
jgi:Uncharacterized protein conserved in bacteria (DUF2218)